MPSIQKTSPINIAITGLLAESRRMKVISNNIANASTTNGPGGKPYRRQVVQLSTDPSGGVSVRGVAADNVTPLKKIYEPAGGTRLRHEAYCALIDKCRRAASERQTAPWPETR